MLTFLTIYLALGVVLLSLGVEDDFHFLSALIFVVGWPFFLLETDE